MLHTVLQPIRERRSLKAFDPLRPVESEILAALFEAARWAPSSYNEQPWRFLLFDGKMPELLEAMRSCLVEENRWARSAPVLLLSLAKESLTRTIRRNRHAEHDVGLATQNLVLQAVQLGMVTHLIGGFDAEKSVALFNIPSEFRPMAVVALGYPLPRSPMELTDRRLDDVSKRERRSIEEFVFQGKWGEPFQGL